MADRSNVQAACDLLVRVYGDLVDAARMEMLELGIAETAVNAAFEDEEFLQSLMRRYFGQMDRIDVLDVGVRQQLVFDLGCVMGLCAKLLAERRV